MHSLNPLRSFAWALLERWEGEDKVLCSSLQAEGAVNGMNYDDG